MPVMEDTERSLTAREAARKQGVHLNTIYFWIRQGMLKARRIGKHGHYKILESDLDALEQETMNHRQGE